MKTTYIEILNRFLNDYLNVELKTTQNFETIRSEISSVGQVILSKKSNSIKHFVGGDVREYKIVDGLGCLNIVTANCGNEQTVLSV